MDIQVPLDDRLANAIASSYDSKNFSGAIIDAIHLLGDLIRNKSGLDLDGNQLVGQAFAGSNPLIKVNSLQTESDREEQKGIEQLLRGVYTGIRNPRSHAKKEDDPQSAKSLIIMIDFLIRTIDKGRSLYDVPSIISQVFDQHFASNEKYANLLVDEIPVLKRYDVLMQVFQRRLEGDGQNVALFCNALLSRLTSDEQTEFWAAASESLRLATSDAEFRSIIQITGKLHWHQISEIARVRAENRLIKSVRAGRVNLETGRCRDGALGTWASGLSELFTLQTEYVSALAEKLESGDPGERGYMLRYFFVELRRLRPEPPMRIVIRLIGLLQEHDEEVYKALHFVENRGAHQRWVEALGDAYCQYEHAPDQFVLSDDDVPF